MTISDGYSPVLWCFAGTKPSILFEYSGDFYGSGSFCFDSRVKPLAPGGGWGGKEGYLLSKTLSWGHLDRSFLTPHLNRRVLSTMRRKNRGEALCGTRSERNSVNLILERNLDNQ